MVSKIYIQCVEKIIPKITESLRSDYTIYMDNDSKHISIESLKIYKSNLISIKLGPAYSPDLNSIENLWGLIKREIISKSFKSLAEVQNFVENTWSKILIETWENTIKGMSNRYSKIITLGGKNIEI